MQNSLLIAMTDSKGISHLLNYQLDTVVKPVRARNRKNRILAMS